MKLYVALILSLILSVGAQAQISPNGKIRVFNYVTHFTVKYNVEGKWQTIMDVPFPERCKNVADHGKKSVKYDMVAGKKSRCVNEYSDLIYWTVSGKQLHMRIYNDGVAWDYLDANSVSLGEEYVDDFPGYTVDFSTAKNSWCMKWTDSYEGFFPQNSDQIKGQRYGYPALFEFDNGIFALLSESNIDKTNAAASYYATEKKNVFSVRRDGKEPMASQTLIVGTLSDVVESTLITDNSAPCKIKDDSWIEPGVASWVYWAYNHGSKEFDIIKKYVDMAAELKLPYVLIDAEWDEMDKIPANEGKTVEDAVKYAKSIGVKPMIWYNSSIGWVNGAPGPKYLLNKPEDMEKQFKWCKKIGVAGVKIDFFSGDTNQNIKFMIELLECAAKHHLLVNFHGATIPRGWQRTYPNLISTEGVYGAEWYNNVPTFTDKAAMHNATLPFTRNVVGPMDYTPCAFTDSQHPHITTHAHELALTALFESGIQHLADRPESFLSQPQEVKDYLSNLPTAWDDTHLLAGYPGDYVVIARQKDGVWYITGINGNDESKIMAFDLKKLKGIGKKAIVFEDGDDVSAPWKITRPKRVPTAMQCKARGGFVMVVK